MPLAARVGDMHTCPMVTGLVPHVGGPILPPCCLTVIVGMMPQARVGDMCTCVGPPDVIAMGSPTVLIGNMLAARIGDPTVHGGVIVVGCPTVIIGSAGTSGNPSAATLQCQAAAAGRNPPPGAVNPAGNQIPANTPGQSYNNCGVEASRQIINQATGANISQEALLDQAVPTISSDRSWWVGPINPARMFNTGGTTPSERAALLTKNGVPASTAPGTMQNLELAVAQGKGVVAAVDAGLLWNPAFGAPLKSWHAILVTGVEYDANGNILNVIVNDTGIGTCGQKVPAATFKAALAARGADHVITNNRVW